MFIKLKMASLGLVCLLLLASGCVELAVMYNGKAVSKVPVIALQEGGSIKGRWETFDLIIDYQYIKKGDRLEISGQTALTQHYQMIYDQLSRMRAYIFFLDQNSRVLETAPFADAWPSSTQDIQDFSESYTVPQGTTKISFGYSGQVRDGKTLESFYKLPLD